MHASPFSSSIAACFVLLFSGRAFGHSANNGIVNVSSDSPGIIGVVAEGDTFYLVSDPNSQNSDYSFSIEPLFDQITVESPEVCILQSIGQQGPVSYSGSDYRNGEFPFSGSIEIVSLALFLDDFSGCVRCLDGRQCVLANNSIAPGGVRWSLTLVSGSGDATIAESGTFHPGTTGGVYRLTAVSCLDPTICATATVTVYSPGGLTLVSNPPSNEDYLDTSSNSIRKVEITYSPTPATAEAAAHFAIVQLIQGSVTVLGRPITIEWYHNRFRSIPFSFPEEVIDSCDENPIYGEGVETTISDTSHNRYGITDSPGTIQASWPNNSRAELNFRTGVFCRSDIPDVCMSDLSFFTNSISSISWEVMTTLHNESGTVLFTHP